MQPTRLLALICCTLLAPHCKNTPDSTDEPPTQPPLFELLTPSQTGVQFINKLIEDADFNYLNFDYLYIGGAVGVIDFNVDGLEDLYFVATHGNNKLFQNMGDMQFEDVTATAGVAAPTGIKTGVAIVDINHDGYPDIYQCRTGKTPADRGNLLFVNNKNGTFSEQATAYGLQTTCPSNQATFFDFDLDGDLDMYLLNHPVEFETVNDMRLHLVNGTRQRRITPEPDDPWSSDRLYRNDKGHYKDISKQAGIVKRAFGLSATILDANNDGYPDIYVGNDYVEPDNLFINNKNGSFTDKIFEYMRHTAHFSMGADVADFNNDLLQDLIVLDMDPHTVERKKQKATIMTTDRYHSLVQTGYGHQMMRNMLQMNNGNQTFSEIGLLAGLSSTDWSWSPLAADFDNDGLRDVFISNGFRREVTDLDYINFTLDSVVNQGRGMIDVVKYLDRIPTEPVPNFLFRNNGDLTFNNVSAAWGIDKPSISNAAVYSDLDNDGDLDIVVNNATENAFIYRNKSNQKPQAANYIKIKLVGTEPNINAVGSVVYLKTGAGWQIADANPIRGFLSSSSPQIHFGLGTYKQIDSLVVNWPGNKTQVLTNIHANQLWVLDRVDAKPGKTVPAQVNPSVKFSEVPRAINTHHKENVYNDFDRERLLFHGYSNQGPALAVADVNGDGFDDAYLGGAIDNSGTLLIQNKDATFTNLTAPFLQDARFEDTDAIFFDADLDGDQDLYIVSGGNEYPANHPNYQDRLYFNDGKGNFSPAPDKSIPKETTSGACVSTLDFDNDGDLDLFVGARILPGQYPLPPSSFVLKNDHGTFTNVTREIAPDFANIGLCTDIHFADLNQDGQKEMLLTGDWMPITILTLKKGKFVLSTEKFNLGQTNGWWNCLETADLDNDGDLDIVAGNTGLNTRFRASPTNPLRLYAKDFDGNNSIDPIMTWSFDGRESTVAFRDVLLKQLPAMKKKFVRYAPYARATLSDVFTDNELTNAQQEVAYTLHTTVFINQKGKFTSQTLPPVAQSAPTKTILISDVDNNGTPDLILGGNDYGMEVETGRVDAGNGCILLNNGKAQFTYLPNHLSGFWTPGEVRAYRKIKRANGKNAIMVANNNGPVQLFQ
jgi:hypothetical protein